MVSKIVQDRWLNELSSKKAEIFVNLLNDINQMKETDENVEIDMMEIEELVQYNDYIKMKEYLTDMQFIERVQDELGEIPESNGSEFFQKIDVNIGIIADEFLYNSFKDIANFYYIDQDNYKNMDIEVFIVSSTWRGLNDEWNGLWNPKILTLRQKLDEIISFYKQKDVKIVFYSKEDPTNYNFFIDIAKKCDYIFTTASEKVENYKKDCDNDKVFVLEFGVNPIYNNPIGMINENKNDDGAIFAGSWYDKYPKRKKDSRTIFDGIIEANRQLKIIDRNFKYNYKKHLFPIEYLKYVSPGIDHETLQRIFKLFTWTINLNSVQTSETMFANRVYELQAMGNIVLSNYSVGVNNLFPNVFIIQNSKEVQYIMQNLSPKELYMHQMFGVRKVLREHTTFHRVEYLLNNIGIKKKYISDRKIAVVVDDKNNEKHLENFNRQTIENKKLVSISQILEENGSFDYFTFFNSDYEYGEFYLEDLINGFKYTNSIYVTKDAYYNGDDYVKGIEHGYIGQIKDKYKTLFSAKQFIPRKLIENDSLYAKGGYSVDSLEINVNPGENAHTENNYELSVIIPVYNNGEHLYGKCFSSLMRSTMFRDMDIILVDDGSTDRLTIKIIDRLKRLYPNVQVYKFNDGGSGSASRPRNKGLKMAKADYITYLDPDNEAINNGYYYLFKEIKQDPSLDMVVGNVIKFDNMERSISYAPQVMEVAPSGIVTDTYQLLKKMNLRVQSIQALIVKKNIVLDNNLKMVEKSAGQDTLFYQELLLNCSKIKVIDLDIHIYYGAVSNSVTNSIDSNFFRKYLEISKVRYEFLKENGLLEHYMTTRFSDYFIKWFLFRVQRIPKKEAVESLEILNEIYNIYEPDLVFKEEPLLVFERSIKEREYLDFINYCKGLFNPNRIDKVD